MGLEEANEVVGLIGIAYVSGVIALPVLYVVSRCVIGAFYWLATTAWKLGRRSSDGPELKPYPYFVPGFPGLWE